MELNLKDTRFGQILTRSNKDIRDDRAITIMEEAELELKREIENMERDIKALQRKKAAMLDLSPGNSYSLKIESFDATLFVRERINIGLEIRNIDIKLQIAKADYQDLFGQPAPPTAAVATT